jgi:hypothetical protein
MLWFHPGSHPGDRSKNPQSLSALHPEDEVSEGCFLVEIPQRALVLSLSEIALASGYPADRVPEYFGAFAESAEREIRERMRIQTGYVVVRLEIPSRSNQGIRMGQIESIADRRLIGYLGQCTQVAVFLVTLGPGVDTFIQGVQQGGDPLMAFMANHVAALFAEQATEVLHGHIGASFAARGMGITNRYSPGYCNWDVGQQRALFQLFPTGFCGVQLTDSCLMLPMKSVSGIIGVGRGAQVLPYDCGHCSQSDCNYRSIKQQRSFASVPC